MDRGLLVVDVVRCALFTSGLEGSWWAGHRLPVLAGTD
jgi:hypothetical protein